MNLEELVEAMTPERYQALMRAVELGKWFDGRVLSKEERASSLQALIAYDARRKPVEERIGYVPTPEDESDCNHDSGNLIAKT